MDKKFNAESKKLECVRLDGITLIKVPTVRSKINLGKHAQQAEGREETLRFLEQFK